MRYADLVEIGEDIRRKREAAGLSQAELARRAKISRRQLINIENGADPKTSTLQSLAAALGCSMQMRENEPG